MPFIPVYLFYSHGAIDFITLALRPFANDETPFPLLSQHSKNKQTKKKKGAKKKSEPKKETEKK
jgi:hypothetical protein